MPGHNGARLHAYQRAQILGDAIGNAVKAVFGAIRVALPPLHFRFLFVHRALGDGQNGKRLFAVGARLDHLGHFPDIIGNFGQKHHVRAAGKAGIQRQPARLVAHDLNHHAPPVRGGGGMDAVNHVGGDIHGGVEAEGKIRAVNIVVDGLGQADHVQPLLAEQVGRFVRAVAAQRHQTIQLHLLVICLHRLDLVHIVFTDDAHIAEGLPARA